MNTVRHRLLLVLSLLWLAAVALLTLQPLGWGTPVPFWAFFSTVMSSVDAAQNIVLFAPMGWFAQRGGWRVWRTVAIAFAISAFIEFAQQWVPGRTSQAQDIVCNTLGALVGWWMAAPVRRPRVRMAVMFIGLLCFFELHALNTTWPDLAVRADGAAQWQTVERQACPRTSRVSTVCVVVPNARANGSRYLRIVGPDEATYARVQAEANGRRLTRRDCVKVMFEGTIGVRLELRAPLMAACAVADSTDSLIALRIDPRLEHESSGGWTPTRAGVWIWPVWPFAAYQPMQQVAAGALVFIVIASLFVGQATWLLPAGYLIVLSGAALITGMRAPGWWEITWTAVAWVAAFLALMLDRVLGATREAGR